LISKLADLYAAGASHREGIPGSSMSEPNRKAYWKTGAYSGNRPSTGAWDSATTLSVKPMSDQVTRLFQHAVLQWVRSRPGQQHAAFSTGTGTRSAGSKTRCRERSQHVAAAIFRTSVVGRPICAKSGS